MPSQAAFKRQLKTFLFCDAFNIVYDEPSLFYIALCVCNAPMVFYYVMGALANFLIWYDDDMISKFKVNGRQKPPENDALGF